MIKRKIVETVEEYDKNGKLVTRTVTETEETDDNPVQYVHSTTPYVPYTAYCCPAVDEDQSTGTKVNVSSLASSDIG